MQKVAHLLIQRAIASAKKEERFSCCEKAPLKGGSSRPCGS